jgi:hypothetical protein
MALRADKCNESPQELDAQQPPSVSEGEAESGDRAKMTFNGQAPA